MDVTTILDQLNEAQREAVSAPLGHALVLAGSWQWEDSRINPENCLAC